MIYSKIGGKLAAPKTPTPKPPSCKFTKQGDAHTRTDDHIKFLYYPLPRDLRNIHNTGNSCRDALPCTNMALKLPWYFYLLMEKPLSHYFQVQSPYYQVA